MGMFDEVSCSCPNCGHYLSVAQSKAGDCNLIDYDINSVPIEIAKDIEGQITFCGCCHKRYRIESLDIIPQTVPMTLIEE